MKAYHVISKDGGWIIDGSSNINVFRTKELAVLEAAKIAKLDKVAVIVHYRDGRVMSVNNNFQEGSGRKLFHAKVKRPLDSKSVRKAIAQVMYSNSQV